MTCDMYMQAIQFPSRVRAERLPILVGPGGKLYLVQLSKEGKSTKWLPRLAFPEVSLTRQVPRVVLFKRA